MMRPVIRIVASRWLLAVGLVLCPGCRETPAWAAPDWRPAAPPQRIVAASLLATEVLLAIAPRDRIAGVHVLALDPGFSTVVAAAQGLPTVGAEPEQLLAVQPDLVICDAYTRPETLALLSAASVPVVVTRDAGDFDGIAANLLRIGQVCHLDAAAGQLVAQMRTRLEALSQNAASVAGWRVINLDGGLHTYGRGSLFAALLDAAGAAPLAVERGVGPFRKVDVETLLAWQPDALVIAGEHAAGAADVLPDWIRHYPGLSLLKCVAAGRLLRVPGPLLNTTSHRLVEAAELVQRELQRWGKP